MRLDNIILAIKLKSLQAYVHHWPERRRRFCRKIRREAYGVGILYDSWYIIIIVVMRNAVKNWPWLAY